MSSDWWSKKLGGNVPPAGIQIQPQYMQPQPQYVQPQLPLQHHDQQRQQLPPPQVSTIEKRGEATLTEAIRSGVVGPAGRLEGHLSCPSCGSRTGYTEYSGGSGGSPGGSQPAPHCFNCGYNGRFTQADQASWAV